MRIVHAVRSDGFAGVERHVAQLAGAQADLGHDVLVLGGDQTRVRAALGGAPVRQLPAATVLETVRHLRSWAPTAEVLHVHMSAAEVAATLTAATLPRGGLPPVVTTRHFASLRGRGPLGPVTASLAAARVVAQISISRYVAEHVEGDSVVVHPGVPTLPDGLPATRRDHVVLMVQRLEPEKATAVGLRAFARSGLAARGWRLDVAGDGSQRAALVALTAGLGLAGSVRFLGARSDVGSLMDRAAVLLAPCAVEGLGLSVLEAMAAGLPVLASSAGGHLETLGGLDPLALYPLTGALSPADAAGDQLAELAGDVARREDYGRRARAAQRSRFTPAAQVAATQAVYEELR